MTLTEFKHKLKSENPDVEEISTNNAWGFGGAIKKVYPYGDYTVHIGRACYRHTKPTAFINIRDKEGCIVAEGKRQIEAFLNDQN